MIYEQIETAIVARLQLLMPSGVNVVKLPENEEDMQRPFASGRVTIFYKASRYSEPNAPNVGIMKSTDHIVQNETVVVEVAVQSRFLRSSGKGVYDIWEKLRRGLIGYKPADCNRIYARDFEYSSYQDGIFTYVGNVECNRLSVQEVEEEILGTIKQIDTNYNIST